MSNWYNEQKWTIARLGSALDMITASGLTDLVSGILHLKWLNILISYMEKEEVIYLIPVLIFLINQLLLEQD